MKPILAALVAVALPLLWFAWQWHSLSVRWGTSDPCGMISEKLREQIGVPISVREEGAFACWMSVLFGAPTDHERWASTAREAKDILDGWASCSALSRQIAVGRTLSDQEVREIQEVVAAFLIADRAAHRPGAIEGS